MGNIFKKWLSYVLILSQLWVFNFSYAMDPHGSLPGKEDAYEGRLQCIPVRQVGGRYQLDLEEALGEREGPVTIIDEETREVVGQYLSLNERGGRVNSLSIFQPFALNSLLRRGTTYINSSSSITLNARESIQDLWIQARRLEVSRDFSSNQRLQFSTRQFINRGELTAPQLSIEARQEGRNLGRIIGTQYLELAGSWFNRRNSLMATEGIFQVAGSLFENQGTYLAGIGSQFDVARYRGNGRAITGLWNIVHARTEEEEGVVEIGEDFFFQGASFNVDADIFRSTQGKDKTINPDDLLPVIQVVRSVEIESNNIPESHMLINQLNQEDDFAWVREAFREQLGLDINTPAAREAHRIVSSTNHNIPFGVRVNVEGLLQSDMEIVLERGDIRLRGQDVNLMRDFNHGKEEGNVTYVEGEKTLYLYNHTLGKGAYLHAPLKRFGVSHHPAAGEEPIDVLFPGEVNQELIYQDVETPEYFAADTLVLSGGETYGIQKFDVEDLIFDETGTVFLRDGIFALRRIAGRANVFDLLLRNTQIETPELLLQARSNMIFDFLENAKVKIGKGRLEVEKTEEEENEQEEARNILTLWDAAFENREDLVLEAPKINFRGTQEQGRFFVTADDFYSDRLSSIRNGETHLRVQNDLYSGGRIETDVLRAQARQVFFTGPIEARVSALIETSSQSHIADLRAGMAQVDTGNLTLGAIDATIAHLRSQGFIMGDTLRADFARVSSAAQQYFGNITVDTVKADAGEEVRVRNLSSRRAQATGRSISIGSLESEKVYLQGNGTGQNQGNVYIGDSQTQDLLIRAEGDATLRRAKGREATVLAKGDATLVAEELQEAHVVAGKNVGVQGTIELLEGVGEGRVSVTGPLTSKTASLQGKEGVEQYQDADINAETLSAEGKYIALRGGVEVEHAQLRSERATLGSQGSNREFKAGTLDIKSQTISIQHSTTVSGEASIEGETAFIDAPFRAGRLDANLGWLFNRDRIQLERSSSIVTKEGLINQGDIIAEEGLKIEAPHNLNLGNVHTVEDLSLYLQRVYELRHLLSGEHVQPGVLYVDVEEGVDIPTTDVPFELNLTSQGDVNFRDLILQQGGSVTGENVNAQGSSVTSHRDFTIVARRNLNRQGGAATVKGKLTQRAGGDAHLDRVHDRATQHEVRVDGRLGLTGYKGEAVPYPNSGLSPSIDMVAGEIEGRAVVERRGNWSHEYDVLVARPVFDSQGNLRLVARRKFLLEVPLLSGNGEMAYGSLTGDASLLAVTLEEVRRWQEVHKKRKWYGGSKKTTSSHERRDSRLVRPETRNKGNVVEFAPQGTLHEQAPYKNIEGNLTMDAKNIDIEAGVTHHLRKTESRTKSSGVAGIGSKSSTHSSYKEWDEIVCPEFDIRGDLHVKAREATFESVVGQVEGDFIDETDELLFLAKMISRHEEEHNTFKKFSAKGGHGYTLDASQEVTGDLWVRNFIEAIQYNYLRDQEGEAYREEKISPDSQDGRDTNVCGFNALNVERVAIVEELASKLQEEDQEGGDLYHKLMAPEVADIAEGAIRRGENPGFDSIYQHDEEYQTLRGLYQSVRAGDPTIRDQIVERIRAWARKTSILETYLRQHVGRPGVMMEYLEQTEALSYRTGVMDAIAQLRGYNLHIYVKGENGRLVQVHHYKGGDEEINLHHTAYNPDYPERINHYNRLEAIDLESEESLIKSGKVHMVGNPLHVSGEVRSRKTFETREPTTTSSYTPYAWHKARNQGLCAAIAIAMTATGNYVGAQLFASLGAAGAAMGGAAIGSTFSTTANAVLNGESVGRALGSKEFLRSAATSVATAGLTSHLGEVFEIAQKPTTFLEHTTKAALRAGVNIATQSTIGGQPINQVLQGALTGMAADIMGGMGANAIGEGYFRGQLDPITHKLAHALLGGATGALMSLDDPSRGAAAGALGAFVAETVLDLMTRGPSLEDIVSEARERKLNEQEFHALYQERLGDLQALREDNAKWGKIASVTGALLLGQEVNIAYQTGSNAVDNNWLMLVYYGAVAASILYSAYQAYDIYETEGPEAALRHLGIEVVTNVAGGVAGRVAGKAVGKVGCYIGETYYPTVKAAVTAVLDKNPTLKLALGKFADKLVATEERILSSKAGQMAQRVERKLVDAEQQITDKVARPFRSKSSAARGSGVSQAKRESISQNPTIPASSSRQARLLHNQLRAEQIVKGHAFEKHRLHQGEFPYFRTEKQLQTHVENILSNPRETYNIGPGRVAYVDRSSHTVVVVDEVSTHGGTVFQPEKTIDEFLKQRGWKK